MRLPTRHRIPALVLAAAVVAVAGAAAAGCSTGPAAPSFVMVDAVTPPPLGRRETEYPQPHPAPPLRLTDQDGRPFDLASLRGTPTFVYFGYTHCPDICPTTLADLRTAIAAAGVPARVVFVTVDPARDTAAAMKTYVDFYAAGFIGLTGTAQDVAAAAAAWGAGYRQGPADANGRYPMTHTTEAYLVDGRGDLRSHLYFGAPTNLIVSALLAAGE